MDRKGSDIFSISYKYLRHLSKSGFRNGHGVHSPFVYDLIRNVIFNKGAYSKPKEAIALHRKLRSDKRIVFIEDMGAGSRITKSSKRKVSSIARKSSVSFRQGALLHRLCKWYQPEEIIELGTGLGISTTYLASGASGVKVISIEASKEKFDIAQELNPDVKFINSSFVDQLQGLGASLVEKSLIFIDGDHRYEPVIRMVDEFLARDDIGEIMLILDDIYWSDGMEKAWKTCISDSRIDISLDLFKLGILIKHPGIEKQHFRVKF